MKWLLRAGASVATLAAIVLALDPAGARGVAFQVVEYGGKSDGIGAVLAEGLDPRNTPATIAVTDDGAVWFRETFTWHPRIARFGRDGSFREYPAVGQAPDTQYYTDSYDEFVPLVADGNDVLVGPAPNSPGQASSLSSDGVMRERSTSGCLWAGPNLACLAAPKAMAAFPPGVSPNSVTRAPDDSLWFTDEGHSLIGRVGSDGRTATYVRGLTRFDSGPQFITVGPDGNLWFTEVRDRIGRVTLDGHITEFSSGIPHRSSLGGIVAGPDGNLWFTLFHGMVLGRITPTGRVTLFHDLVYPSDGHDFDPVAMIVRDREGRLYYNEGQAGRIARVTLVH
jgi:streptogramin lyase